MRILGVDFGIKRIGLALSDPLMIIASPLKTIASQGIDDDISQISAIIKDNEVQRVVVGLPRNMDGSEGAMAQNAREFGNLIGDKCGVEVIFKDERLSSVTANKALDEGNVHWKKRKDIVDTMAAQIILQAYLDARK